VKNKEATVTKTKEELIPKKNDAPKPVPVKKEEPVPVTI